MKQQQYSNQFKYLQKISQQLRQNKKFRVVNLNQYKRSFDQIIIAENLVSKSLHTIKIISIFDGIDQVCQQKLQDAQQEALFLKNTNHQNIIKYCDEFQIGFNYFIIMEKCEKNLQQFIEEFKRHKTEIPKHLLVSFACQILQAINYLHQQNQALTNLSLRNILIDSENQIKLYDLGLAKQVQEEFTSSLIFTIFPRRPLFYYPPELLEQLEMSRQKNQIDKLNNFLNGDIWAFGLCLYALAGASLQELSSLKSKGYQKLTSLDNSLNSILSQILSLDPNQRPNAEKLIDFFEDLRKEIQFSDDSADLYKHYLEKDQAGQIYLAYQFISICCQIQQKNETYWFRLGLIYSKLKLYNEAIKSYLKCLEINPQHGDCYNNLGCIYAEQGLKNESFFQFQKSLEIDPNDHIYYLNLGNIQSDKGLVDEAIKSYQKCLTLNPNHKNCQQQLKYLESQQQRKIQYQRDEQLNIRNMQRRNVQRRNGQRRNQRERNYNQQNEN